MSLRARLIRWLGGVEAPPAPEDIRGWNEDWQVGDLAVCVCAGFNPPHPTDPVRGEVLRVSALSGGVSASGKYLISTLRFEGKPQGTAYHCKGFRKIRPDLSADEIETGLIAKIKGRAGVRA